jgi:hypothetical protein
VIFVLKCHLTRFTHVKWWTRFRRSCKVARAAVVFTTWHESVIGNLKSMTKWIVSWCLEFWAREIDRWSARLASLAITRAALVTWHNINLSLVLLCAFEIVRCWAVWWNFSYTTLATADSVTPESVAFVGALSSPLITYSV